MEMYFLVNMKFELDIFESNPEWPLAEMLFSVNNLRTAHIVTNTNPGHMF